jgi:tetratricopeptide (TPR) repeat protein
LIRGSPMFQKISTFVFLLSIILSCSQKAIDDIVVVKPGEPKAGDKITLKFFPKRLINPEQQEFSVYLVWQFFDHLGVRQDRMPMEKMDDFYTAKIPSNKSDYLLSFKFEDSMDRCEDNNGRGWNIVLKNKNGEVRRNSSYKLASIYNNTIRAGRFPNNKKATQYFKDELTLYPDNYKAWFDLWVSKLKQTATPSETQNAIASELDSLLACLPASAELLTLDFKTKLKLLDETDEAIKVGERLMRDFDIIPQKDELFYLMIFLRNKTNQEAIVNDLEKFVKQTKNKDYLKKVYRQLGMFFRQQGKIDQSIQYYEKYLQIDSTNTSTWLIQANNFLKVGKPELSKKMIDKATKMNTTEFVFMNNPWATPADRISTLRLTDCQIQSTKASLNETQKEFTSAIENRKKCIDLGTPFPAYEWEKIGDIFMETAHIDSASKAYIKAVSINSNQNSAINKLKNLFRRSGAPLIQFDSYLMKSVRDEQQASAEPAPDIMLTDLQNNRVALNQQKDHITVLVFWDSWGEASQKEIIGLNKLKEIFADQNNISLWAVSVDDPVSIKTFLRETPFNFRLFHSGFAAKKAFNVIGFPTHFIIDGNGKIRYQHVGFLKNIKSELQTEIQFLLIELNKIS